ncbi:hypothetical protein DFH29DRAFT_983677 [Suillus ampliporus]|nr:hypothetical protein DFH29DRAFT_983677 [Suillus ampliporus]
MAIDSEIVSIGIKPTNVFLTSALVHQGLIPCSLITPSIAITIDTIEFYRVAHLRNPHFSIQAFVKMLCDLHGFLIAFDLYIQIGGCVDSLVTAALRRDMPDWCLKHTCPSCTYELQDEQSLRLRLLYAMDGNDSLKWILCRTIGMDDDNIGPSSELPTPQQVSGDQYLTREYVDQWSREVLNSADNEEVKNCSTRMSAESEDNLCTGCWKNMDDEKTKKAWGIYDETGIFLAVCRHGFSLLLADMVQSGELAKYPLAVISKLMDAFGEGLGGGYDIGCQFKTTLDNSSLGPVAHSLHYTSLVGAFHGHAHRRLCQLDHLTTYIPGLGLEDLETCERTFSKSNGLASSLRYASVFHRQQGILTYFEHNDDYEVYANLSNFLYNNYKQALEILYDGQTSGVSDESIFEDWLKEEREYLHGLRSEPQQETLQMEYWQKLVNLTASKDELDTSSSRWSMYALSSTTSDEATTWWLETTRCHATEVFEKDLKIVQELESKLEITQRWVPKDAEWQNAAIMVTNHKYQRALDNLEGLVVAHIFELTKMNRSGTGYKMRKHIAKALQTQSAAIRTALERYNSAAWTLSPPCQTLKWEEVVEYAFLANFDLLRNSREDVSQQQWATPTARQATNLYFKMCHAKEEITCLNIEIRRLVTYMCDEDHYLRTCQRQLKAIHPALAHQVHVRHHIHARFNAQHLKHLGDIANLSGFTGSVIPGESILTGVGESTNSLDNLEEKEEEEEEEEEEEVNVEEASEIFYNILHISTDP